MPTRFQYEQRERENKSPLLKDQNGPVGVIYGLGKLFWFMYEAYRHGCTLKSLRKAAGIDSILPSHTIKVVVVRLTIENNRGAHRRCIHRVIIHKKSLTHKEAHVNNSPARMNTNGPVRPAANDEAPFPPPLLLLLLSPLLLVFPGGRPER